MDVLDQDLETLSRDQLVHEALRLRAAIRVHRDSTGQELCWHHPALWDLLPEKTPPRIAVPSWPSFMKGCVRYRLSLESGAAAAAQTTTQHQGTQSMPIKSQAQRRKFAELLVEGKIKPEVFERWNREAGSAELPEHVKPKKAAAKKSAKKVAKRKVAPKPKTAAKRKAKASVRRSAATDK